MGNNEDETSLKEIVNGMLNNLVHHYKGFWITKFSGEVVFVLKKNQDLKILCYTMKYYLILLITVLLNY